MERRYSAVDPTPQVEAAFQRIQRERMADMPLLNKALRVEAVGFRRWQANWLGILITPWAMSLLLVPGDGGDWEQPAEGRRRIVRLPSAEYMFLSGSEPEIGEYQTCALISPLPDFPDQETARATALAALPLLLTAAAAPSGDQPASPSRRRFFTGVPPK